MTIPFLTEDITVEIESLAAQSKSIMATTAFWTIPPGFFTNNYFVNLLCNKDSYFIVDISEPTIVENLVAYSQQDCNLYIYLKRAKDDLYKYNHLLHSKLMLFAHAHDDEYTLLIGSANMTTRALKGINKEAGVMITLTKKDVLLSEVLDYLSRIKRESVKVDPSKLELYKFIQNDGNLFNFYQNCPLLYLAAQDNEYNNLTNGKIVQMLGLNDEHHEFYSKIESLNKQIALLVNNINNGDSKVCVCSLSSIGEIKINTPETFQKDYDERLYFYIGLTEFTGASTPSFVYPSNKILQQMFYVADFHAELLIEGEFSKVYSNEFSIKNKIKPWHEIQVFDINEKIWLHIDSYDYVKRGKLKKERRHTEHKIKIEQIIKDCFKDDFILKITEELTPTKLKLEEIYPPDIHERYVAEHIELNSWISQVSINIEDRSIIKKKIDKYLIQIYESNKKVRQVLHKNIRLLKPSLVFNGDLKRLSSD